MQEKLIKEPWDFKDCRTCAIWKPGITLIECFGKHHWSDDFGCLAWVKGKRINYTDEDIEQRKFPDPTKYYFMCDNDEEEY